MSSSVVWVTVIRRSSDVITEMTQVKFKDSIDWRTYRPAMEPWFHGMFTPVESERPNPWYPSEKSEFSRRYEGRTIAGRKPSYKKNAVPAMNSAKIDPMTQIGRGKARLYDLFHTEEGSLQLPRQGPESLPTHFQPDSRTLDIATQAVDTRFHDQPLRYYR